MKFIVASALFVGASAQSPYGNIEEHHGSNGCHGCIICPVEYQYHSQQSPVNNPYCFKTEAYALAGVSPGCDDFCCMDDTCQAPTSCTVQKCDQVYNPAFNKVVGECSGVPAVNPNRYLSPPKFCSSVADCKAQCAAEATCGAFQIHADGSGGELQSIGAKGSGIAYNTWECYAKDLSFTVHLGAADFYAHGKHYQKPAEDFEFQVVTASQLSGDFHAIMMNDCGAIGMKPVCAEPFYCQPGTQDAQDSLWIGNHQGGFLTKRYFTNMPNYFPAYFKSIRDKFSMLCAWGTPGPNVARDDRTLCNTENSIGGGTMTWVDISQRTTYPSIVNFMCGRVAPAPTQSPTTSPTTSPTKSPTAPPTYSTIPATVDFVGIGAEDDFVVTWDMKLSEVDGATGHYATVIGVGYHCSGRGATLLHGYEWLDTTLNPTCSDYNVWHSYKAVVTGDGTSVSCDGVVIHTDITTTSDTIDVGGEILLGTHYCNGVRFDRATGNYRNLNVEKIQNGTSVSASHAEHLPFHFNEGKCYVPNGETVGPQMKDNIDLWGLDFVKYWSPNAEHNNGPLDNPVTGSAKLCCETCMNTPGCNMWTWTKNQQGCYLKNGSATTLYVEQYHSGRVSGGWNADVHLETAYSGGVKYLSTFVLSSKGTDLAAGEWDQGCSGGSCDVEACKQETLVRNSTYFAWANVYGGFCKILKEEYKNNPNLGTDQGYGYQLYERETEVVRTVDTTTHAKFNDEGVMVDYDDMDVIHQAKTSRRRLIEVIVSQTEGACPQGFRPLSQSECAEEYPNLSYDVGNGINAMSGVHAMWWVHGCVTNNNGDVFWNAASGGTHGFPVCTDHVHDLLGIDFPSQDFVKYSNGHANAVSPDACAVACDDNANCVYWSWSHNDPQASCYLKSRSAMADTSFGYGRPVFSCGVTSSFKDPNDIVGTTTPVKMSMNLFRKNFEFIAAIKPVEVPNRPRFYMIGSGITMAMLDDITDIRPGCTFEDWKDPCFTVEEIAEAKAKLEQELQEFSALTGAEKDLHAAEACPILTGATTGATTK